MASTGTNGTTWRLGGVVVNGEELTINGSPLLLSGDPFILNIQGWGAEAPVTLSFTAPSVPIAQPVFTDGWTRSWTVIDGDVLILNGQPLLLNDEALSLVPQVWGTEPTPSSF